MDAMTTVKMVSETADRFAKDLTLKFDDEYVFYAEKGRRFDKIVMERKNGTQRGVHAFVERTTGNLIKAATFKAPQKNSDGTFAVRYNLSTDDGYEEALDAATWSGGYLYKR